MAAQQTLTDRVVESERDIDNLQVALAKVETKLSLMMWLIPIINAVVIGIAGLVFKIAVL